MTKSPTGTKSQSTFQHLQSGLLVGAALLAAGAAFTVMRSSAEQAHIVPPPAVDEQAAPGQAATTEVAVLAGGCFWGVQGVFQHVNGVTNALSGYAGGDKKTAHYEVVGSGTTRSRRDRSDHLRPQQDQLWTDPANLLLGRP